MERRFEAPNVWRARGRGFQMGVVQPPGHVVHLTGQVAWDADERIVGRGDVAAQTRQCFRNIETLLTKVGGRIEDIVSLTTWFLDRADLPQIQSVRGEFFNTATAPVSTSIMVAGLGHVDFLVELTPIAVVPETRFHPPSP